MQIITHNLNADNTRRQLKLVSESQDKSTEKLSSGYRINRSADDAAGLSISEKMRRQIRGLNRASKNIQDGISLVQTADGALNEVHDILQRMNELSVQAANAPNNQSDRSAIQSELDQLRAEINRISKTTLFNTHTVLMAKQLVEIEAEDYSEIPMADPFGGIGGRGANHLVCGKKLDFSHVNAGNKEQLIGKQFFVTCSENCHQIFSFRFTDQTSSGISISGENLSVNIGMKDPALTNGADVVGEIYKQINDKQADFIAAITTARPGWVPRSGDTIIGHANGVTANGANIIFYSTTSAYPPHYATGMGLVKATDMMQNEETFLIQVNDNPYQEIALNLRTINATTLGLGKPDVSSFAQAGKTIDRVTLAIANLSEYRSYLGAVQNRLEKAMAIADNTAENTQSAESKLRDADFANETVRFSKTKILEQFGQAMLAHNNQDTDSILKLLA